MAEVTIAIQRYLTSIANFDLLSKEEFTELAKKYNAGDEFAKKKMISHNLRLVVSICKKYNQYGQDLMDIISEGNLGLIRAVEKYDHETGFAFSTYAQNWIRYFVEKYLSETKKIANVPLHTMKLSRKIGRTVAKAEEEGRQWTVASIAKELEVSESKVSHGLILQGMDDSLNAKLSTDGDSIEAGDLIAQEENEQLSVEAQDRNNMLHLLITELPDKQKQAIIHFYGLFNTSEKSGAAIGGIIGVSRERVRQLLKEAKVSLVKLAKKEGVDLQELFI